MAFDVLGEPRLRVLPWHLRRPELAFLLAFPRRAVF